MQPSCMASVNCALVVVCCAGIDAAPKHAARCRLQLVEYAVLECVDHQLLIQVLSKLSQQVRAQGVGAPCILLGWREGRSERECVAARRQHRCEGADQLQAALEPC